MPTKNFNLRHMRADELPMVKLWVIQEGWNIGSDDLEFCYAAYPEAFYILEVDGKAVGSTTIMRYSEKYAFLGLLVVIPEERGKGYSRNIWDATMELLKDCETIRFYGVLPRKNFYRPFGFCPIAYNYAYVMEGKQISEKLLHPVSVARVGFFRQPKDTDITAMATYEESFLKVRRDRLIAAFIDRNRNTALLATDEAGKILGYSAIRSRVKENTFTIRPLYADTYEIAKAMFFELLSRLSSVSPETRITLDIPLSNPHIEKLVVDFDLDRYVEGDKAYDTAVVSCPHIDEILDTSKVYARFSLEFS